MTDGDITQLDGVKDMTPEEAQARSEYCKKLEDRIISDLRQGREALWDMAGAMYEFHEMNGHTALGYDTQEQWLAQPEIGMTRVEFFRLVRRYKQLVIYRKVPVGKLASLSPSKLDIVMPAIEKNIKPLEEILSDVESLGARDLKETYIGERKPDNGGPPQGGAADPDVIDGQAHDVEPDGSSNGAEPVSADQVGRKPSKEEIKARKDAEALQHALETVDSWVTAGGDRRKAQRNLAAVRSLHPVLRALERVQAAADGGEDAPGRSEVTEDWRTFAYGLGLTLPETPAGLQQA